MYKKIIIIFCLINSLLISKELITPIPINPDFHYKKALLGKKLFFDIRLSKNNTISCSSCHLINDGGDDNLPLSFGIDGKIGNRNAPTLLNARYNSFQFWDGREKTLQEQVKGPIHNPLEMATSFNEIIIKLNKDKYYKKEFMNLYKEEINKDNIAHAIAEFEKTLTTPNSKFDKFLKGDKDILTKDELDGYKLFKSYGCISCHNGINIGGNLIQKIGAIKDYNTHDLGKYYITKNEEDKFYFKVPSLRNIELTAPYFHDGKIKTLKKAVETMMKHQVGYVIDEKEIKNIIKFLKTLTGDTPIIIGTKK